MKQIKNIINIIGLSMSILFMAWYFVFDGYLGYELGDILIIMLIISYIIISVILLIIRKVILNNIYFGFSLIVVGFIIYQILFNKFVHW